ncbi:MAG: ECF-type sigma factor [Planctomycetota bacterium]
MDPAPKPPSSEVTQLLGRLRADADPQHAMAQLMPLVYDELRRLASSYLGRERADHTLQPTALVNEAFVRLVGQRDPFESRGHFMAIAGTAMRRVLVNHARDRQRDKRGGGAARETLVDDRTAAEAPALDLLALDEALVKLGALDDRKVKVVELRYFVGLSVQETALALGVSEKTIKREWQVARAWLRREMSD